MNTSIQDSVRTIPYLVMTQELMVMQFNLAWKLVHVLKYGGNPSILDSYEEERLPVVAEMLEMTTQLLDETRKGIRIDDAVRQALAKEPASTSKDLNSGYHRGSKLHQLGVNYRWSPIVYDERTDKSAGKSEKAAYGVSGQAVQAGDRAPDASGLIAKYCHASGPVVNRLFDLFDPTTHVALIFVSKASAGRFSEIDAALDILPACRKVVIWPPGQQANEVPIGAVDYVFEDREGLAYAGYGVDRKADIPSVVIVRPDAMVGAYVHTVQGVEVYSGLLGLSRSHVHNP